MTSAGGSHDKAAAQRIRLLHPAWYAAVMGTAVLAVATSANPGGVDALETAWDVVSVAFLVIAAVLAAVLGAWYLKRWFSYREAVLADLAHPVLGSLLGTVPGGLLVLAAAFWSAGRIVLPDSVALVLTAVLTTLGAVLAILVSISWAFTMTHLDSLDLTSVTGAWFLPPVIAVLVPLGLAPVATEIDGDLGLSLLLLSFMFWGAGLLLFVLVAALLVARLALRGPPPPPLAPTVWIGMAPTAAGGLALLRMADAGMQVGLPGAETVAAMSTVTAAALLGFSLWWLLFAATVLHRQRAQGTIPWTPGWWAFTFPLGATSALVLALGARADAGPVVAAGVLFLLAAIGMWGFVLARTTTALRAGQAFGR
jgi:C4-dicarboxylate transporter/malic acid transport protein